jgi:hypothetical protein
MTVQVGWKDYWNLIWWKSIEKGSYSVRCRGTRRGGGKVTIVRVNSLCIWAYLHFLHVTYRRSNRPAPRGSEGCLVRKTNAWLVLVPTSLHQSLIPNRIRDLAGIAMCGITEHGMDDSHLSCGPFLFDLLASCWLSSFSSDRGLSTLPL